MKNYIISVIIVSVCSSIAMRIIPENDKSGTGKGVKLLCMLCVICTLIVPLLPFIKNYSSVKIWIDDLLLSFELKTDIDDSDYNKMFDQSLNNVTISCVEDSVKSFLNERFSISTDNVSVEAEVISDDDGKRTLSSVNVTLYGDAVWKNPYRIEEEIERNYGCECVVRSSEKPK